MLFAKRLLEEALHAAVAAGAAVLVTGDLSQAGLVAAGAAAVRAVIGVVAKHFGADQEKPSVS